MILWFVVWTINVQLQFGNDIDSMLLNYIKLWLIVIPKRHKVKQKMHVNLKNK